MPLYIFIPIAIIVICAFLYLFNRDTVDVVPFTTFSFTFLTLVSLAIPARWIEESMVPDNVLRDSRHMTVVFNERAYLTKNIDAIMSETPTEDIYIEVKRVKNWANLLLSEKYFIVCPSDKEGKEVKVVIK